MKNKNFIEMTLSFLDMFETEEEKIAYIKGVVITLYNTVSENVAEKYEEAIYEYVKDVYDITFMNSFLDL